MNLFLSKKLKLPKKERVSPNYSRKISDVLLEFAHEIAPVDAEPDILANAVNLAVLLWNSPLLPEPAQTENMNQIRQWLAEKGRLDLQVEITRLLELRQTRYPNDRRLIMDYDLAYETKGPRLTVSSLDLNRPENQSR